MESIGVLYATVGVGAEARAVGTSSQHGLPFHNIQGLIRDTDCFHSLPHSHTRVGVQKCLETARIDNAIESSARHGTSTRLSSSYQTN